MVEVGKEAGAKRGMDVAARHGGDPREQQPRDWWMAPASVPLLYGSRISNG